MSKELETIDLDAQEVNKAPVEESGVIEEDQDEGGPGEAHTEETEEEAEAEVVMAVNLQVLSDGRMHVELPEGHEDLTERQVEQITKEVYENLYEQRIAANAIEMLKSRLG